MQIIYNKCKIYEKQYCLSACLPSYYNSFFPSLTKNTVNESIHYVPFENTCAPVMKACFESPCKLPNAMMKMDFED